MLARPGSVYGMSEKEASRAPAPPPSPAPADPAPSADAPRASAPPQAARPPVSARDIHMRAVDSAADKRCSEVRTLGDEVRAIDASYYKTKFLTDKRLTACLQSPTPSRNQTQQRK